VVSEHKGMVGENLQIKNFLSKEKTTVIFSNL